MYQKDFILKQLNEFLRKLINNILSLIESNKTDEALEMIHMHYSETIIEGVLKDDPLMIDRTKYEDLIFQGHLLFMKLCMHKKLKDENHGSTKILYIDYIRKVMGLNPNNFDLELHNNLNRVLNEEH